MNQLRAFYEEKENRVKAYNDNSELKETAHEFMEASLRAKYSYNFEWMGVPIIQYPQDLVAMQEIIWRVKPDLIIETGVAHGGSLIFYASLLEMMGIANGRVLGIDIDIREHNRNAIENHPMYSRVELIEGSSTAPQTVQKVQSISAQHQKILVCLDSNHTYSHVLEELKLYSPFVSKNSYLVVFDSVVEKCLEETEYQQRPWGKGNNPYTAIEEFLDKNSNFVVDEELDSKLLVSVCPKGYLKNVSA